MFLVRYSIVFAVVVISSVVSPVMADEGIVDVIVETDMQPSSVVGFIMSSDKTIQKLNPTVARAKHGELIVHIPYAADEVDQDTVVSAMVTGEDGKTVFSKVRPLLRSAADSTYLDIPDCPSMVSSNLPPGAGLADFEALKKIRLDRRATLQAIVTKSLDESYLTKLTQLEKVFGIAVTKPLSPELEPMVLIDRLSRLLNALKAYKQNKSEKEAGAKTDSGQ